MAGAMAEIQTKTWFAILLLSVASYGLVKFFRAGMRTRRFYQGAPGFHDPIWGSLKSMGERMTDDRHFDYNALAIWKELGKPAFYFIDTWPVVRPGTCIIGDVKLAEQIHKATLEQPHSFPKYSSFRSLLAVIGPTSILSQGGEYWKTLRRRYNPGFSSRHLQKFLPEIIRESKIFVTKLEESVGQVITLGDL